MKELELFENEKIEKQTGLEIITAEDRQYINARDLHNSLEVGRDFSNWIKDRIEIRFYRGQRLSKNRKFELAKFGERKITPSNYDRLSFVSFNGQRIGYG